MPSAGGEGRLWRHLRRRRELYVLAAAALILVAWLFGPALADLSGRIVGYPHSEQYMMTWVTKVFTEGLVEHQRLPLWVDGMVYDKGVLTPLSLTTTVISLLLYPFFDTPGLFTATLVVNFLLAFCGAYFLFCRLAGDRWSGFAGALLYALSPYCLDHFAFGPIECTALGWIPLALLCVEKYPGDRLRHALLTGGALALVFAASPYYGVFTALAALYLLLTRADAPLARRLRRAALTMGLAAALVAPLGYGLIATLKHPHSLTPTRFEQRHKQWHREYLSRHAVVDVASVLLPTRAFHTQLNDKSAYLGIPALLLCIVAVIRVRLSRRWVWMGLAFLIFALGASLKIGGYFFQLGDDPVPMPTSWLLHHVPPFTKIYYPIRAMPLAVLAAGAAITLLLARGGLGQKRWQLALICLVLAADMLLGFREWRLPTAPYHVPDYYARLARDRARYGVVDLPAPQSDEDLGRVLLNKLVHRKRVPYNLDRTAYVRGFDRPVYEEQNLALRVAIPNTPRRYDDEARWFRCRLDCSWVRGLRRHGYRYLVLHRTGHRALDRRLVRCLERCTTELVHRDDELRVYRAPPLPAAAGGMR